MSRERISDASVIVPVSRSKLWAEIFQHPPTEQAVKCVKADRTQKGEKKAECGLKVLHFFSGLALLCGASVAADIWSAALTLGG